MGCKECSLRGNTPISGRGDADPVILFIGEAPGKWEDRKGQVFVGKSGKELEHQIRYFNLDDYPYYLDNVLKCHPPNDRTPSKIEVACCKRFIEQTIKELRPEVIVTLGVTASDFIHGEKFTLSKYHGFIYHKPEYLWFPTYHPSAALRSGDSMTLFLDDLSRLSAHLHGRVDATSPKDVVAPVYKEIYGKEEFNREYDGCVLAAVDTEYANNKPWCVSISRSPGFGHVIFPDSPAMSSFKEFVELEDTCIIFHNILYDYKVLLELGIKPTNWTDTMSMAYLLQNKPLKLKHLAYRLCGMEMSSYKEVIGYAGYKRELEYLREVASKDWGEPPYVITKWEPVSDVKEATIRTRIKKLFEMGPLPMKRLSNGEVPYIRKHKSIRTKAAETIARYICSKADPAARWRGMHGKEVTSLGGMPESDLRDVPQDTAIQYAAMDADATIRIYDKLLPEVVRAGLYETLMRDMRSIPFIIDAELHGIKIDRKRFKRLSDDYAGNILETRDRIFEIIGKSINLNSSDQVASCLYDDLGLPPGRRTSTGKHSVDNDELTRLLGAHPVISDIIKYNQLAKMKSTYIDPLPGLADKKDRIHGNFSITRTATGRLACRNPNLMNQPKRDRSAKEYRKAFVAEDGRIFVSADYSQIEIRVTAHVSRDEILNKVLLSGEDVHLDTAKRVFGTDKITKEMRSAAKTVNFGIIYGMQGLSLQGRLAEQGIIWTLEACEKFINNYLTTYVGVAEWMMSTYQYAKRHGFVRDLFGRIIRVPEVFSAHEYIRRKGLRQGGNGPIQSTAQGIIKEAMGCDFYREYDAWPLIQIHDELLFSVPIGNLNPFVDKARYVMETVVDLSVPTPVDIEYGENWGEMKEYEGGDQVGRK